jgi:hypothetical protein
MNIYDLDSDDELAYHIALSDSDTEDNNFLQGSILKLILFIANEYDNERGSFYTRNRLMWERHVQELQKEGAFSRVYRMSLIAFNKLKLILQPLLEVDAERSFRRTKKLPISTEIILSAFIRWTSGGSYHDVRQVAGVSVASFYRVMHCCALAIMKSNELKYNFPTTMEEIIQAAEAFKNISTNGLLIGCVGVMNGLLLRIKVPSSNEVGHVKSFYSGHYSAYGINVQYPSSSNILANCYMC